MSRVWSFALQAGRHGGWTEEGMDSTMKCLMTPMMQWGLIQGASIAGRVATGSRSGQKARRVQREGVYVAFAVCDVSWA